MNLIVLFTNNYTMKTIAKIITTFIVGTLFFTACGKDDNSQIPREKRLKTIEVKDEKTDTIVGTLNYFYDTENRISKIGLKDQNQINFYSIEFTYNTANNVENIRYIMQNVYIDYTYTYTANNSVPTKLKSSGNSSAISYTAEIINNNGTLFWDDYKGDVCVLENVNSESNTFGSLNLNGLIIKFKENNQFKNGLVQKQDMVKLPLLISSSGGILIPFITSYSLQISSAAIERIEASSGEVLNYQLEKDADGYITNSKFTSQGNTLIAMFYYE